MWASQGCSLNYETERTAFLPSACKPLHFLFLMAWNSYWRQTFHGTLRDLNLKLQKLRVHTLMRKVSGSRLVATCPYAFGPRWGPENRGILSVWGKSKSAEWRSDPKGRGLEVMKTEL